MSEKGIVDHKSFLDGVNHSLGVLADACLDAYEENGNPLLEEAANALRAIETVGDLVDAAFRVMGGRE